MGSIIYKEKSIEVNKFIKTIENYEFDFSSYQKIKGVIGFIEPTRVFYQRAPDSDYKEPENILFFPIFDEELSIELNNLENKSNTNLINTIVDYYSYDNFKRIEEKMNSWECIPEILPRMNILKSCLKLGKYEYDDDFFNVIIPTLCVQEDGVFNDIYSLLPDEEKSKLKKDTDVFSGTRLIFALFLAKNGYKCLSAFFVEIIKDTFFSGNKRKMAELAENNIYNKFRNPIAHGSTNLEYDTKENFVRCWLELELLIACLLAVKEILYGTYIKKS